jgi:Mrp family chromosome partitioning ATPase
MIVEKAINMADMIQVKVLGLVENYSYLICPDCGKVIHLYGESHIEELAQKHDTKLLAKIPIDTELASLVDKGVVELFEADYLEAAADVVEKEFPIVNE